jgi:hypothetical protein
MTIGKSFLQPKMTTDIENQANETKSIHMSFIIRKEMCLPITSNGLRIPQANVPKYLGLHLDRKLNWKKYVFT